MSWLSVFAVERDPKKRKVKPVEQPLFDLDLESSDDSDFDPDEHKEVSDDSLDSNEEASAGGSGSSSEDSDEDSADELDEALSTKPAQVTAESLQRQLEEADEKGLRADVAKKKVPKRCWGCLGDRNDDFDELVECDGCGLTVHEKCYGMSDTESLASVDSKNPALPWFCDACRAGVTDPPCELCPNLGGIFKETDTLKWVHLVCVLYIPGLFPTDGEKLSLFKLPYAKYGAKACSLCEDERLARTGVCIECDAGMCKSYFHASCAQKAGLLQEAHPEETDAVDKFYAHCKLHSDKAMIRRRRHNYLLLQVRLKDKHKEVDEKEKEEISRIQRKFAKAKRHYQDYRTNSIASFVPPIQKSSRAIVTSATACRRLFRKAQQAGLDTHAMEIEEDQVSTLKDIWRKWHIPVAFSVEFIAYYLDRSSRLVKMKENLQDCLKKNAHFLQVQKSLGEKYDQAQKGKSEEEEHSNKLKDTLKIYHELVLAVCPQKHLPSVDSMCIKPISQNHHFPGKQIIGGVPTAAALKAGLGFPLNQLKDAVRQDPTIRAVAPSVTETGIVLNSCGICRQSNDPHLLAHCDSCKRYYHLGCLNPPLTRMPKKTKLFGWQCSECDRESSGSDVPCVDVEAPRKLRHKMEQTSSTKVGTKPAVDALDPNSSFSPTVTISGNEGEEITNGENQMDPDIIEIPVVQPARTVSAKKRRREKHRQSVDEAADGSSSEKKRKRKKKSFDQETWQLQGENDQTTPQPHVPKIKIKTIPFAASGEGQTTQTYVASAMTSDDDLVRPALPAVVTPTPTAANTRPERLSSGKKVKEEEIIECDVCQNLGSKTNLVSCDGCKKGYHFHCLDPPVKKSPKIRGYSWHCEDCYDMEASSDD